MERDLLEQDLTHHVNTIQTMSEQNLRQQELLGVSFQFEKMLKFKGLVTTQYRIGFGARRNESEESCPRGMPKNSITNFVIGRSWKNGG